jgi:hypothetical protein
VSGFELKRKYLKPVIIPYKTEKGGPTYFNSISGNLASISLTRVPSLSTI